MIFGKTHQEKDERKQAMLKKLYRKRVKSFALLPTKTRNGTWAWLEFVYLDYGVHKSIGKYECNRLGVPEVYLTQRIMYN